MNLKRLALLVLLGVLVGATIFWVPGRFDDSAGRDGAGGASAEPSASSSPSGSAGADKNRKAADPEPATEALPEAASTESGRPDSGLPGLTEKPRTKPVALISNPLPKQAVRKGSLVAGYPKALAPPARTTVQVSSVSPAKGVLQVALTASCRRPCDVLRHFRTSLAQHAFKEVRTTSVENTPAATLHRGDDSVSVTVVKTSRRSVEYAVFAVLHTKT